MNANAFNNPESIGEFDSFFKDLEKHAKNLQNNGGHLILAVDDAHKMVNVNDGSRGRSNSGNQLLLNKLTAVLDNEDIRFWFLTNPNKTLQNNNEILNKFNKQRLEDMSPKLLEEMVHSIVRRNLIRAEELGAPITYDPEAVELIINEASNFIQGTSQVDAVTRATSHAFNKMINEFTNGPEKREELEMEIKNIKKDIDEKIEENIDNNRNNLKDKSIKALRKELKRMEAELRQMNEIELLIRRNTGENSIDLEESATQIVRDEILQEEMRKRFHLDPNMAARAISELASFDVTPEIILQTQSDIIRNFVREMKTDIVGHTETLNAIEDALLIAFDPPNRNAKGGAYNKNSLRRPIWHW